MNMQNRIKEELKKINEQEVSDDEIITDIGMAEMPLLSYLLSIKYSQLPQVIPIENDLMIRVGECNLANFSYLAISLHFFEFDGRVITLEGLTSTPALISGISFGAYINGKKIDIEMDISDDFDLEIDGNVYEYRKKFYIEVPVEDFMEISFFNQYKDIAVNYGRINSMRFSPIADVIPKQFYYKNGYVFYIVGNKIICKKVENDFWEYEIAYRKEIQSIYPEKYEWIVRLRDYFYSSKKNKPIFLIMDRADSADDNGRVFWEYLLDKKNVESYFVLSKNAKDYKLLRKKGNVVALYSEEHYKLALTADFIISSQCNGVVENPFWDECEYFRDLYHRPKMIFLQHGVIKDDMSPTLNRFNTNFTGFLTSTYDEWKSILEYSYFYSEKEVWNLGLPRFDKLKNKRKKVIVIMPTWRKSLMEQRWDPKEKNMRWNSIRDFKSSNYYCKYNSLLNNKKLRKICRKYGYKIVFVPHPLFRKFYSRSVFNWYSLPRTNVSYREIFEKGALLITDYSSVAYDFLYLKKPVIYYQFDKEDFFSNHTYRPGYFDYKDELYGKVVYEENDLCSIVEEYIKTDCSLHEEHIANVESLFERNNNHCEILYKKLLEYISEGVL